MGAVARRFHYALLPANSASPKDNMLNALATPTSMREAAADPPLLITNEHLPFRSDFTER